MLELKVNDMDLLELKVNVRCVLFGNCYNESIEWSCWQLLASSVMDINENRFDANVFSKFHMYFSLQNKQWIFNGMNQFSIFLPMITL